MRRFKSVHRHLQSTFKSAITFFGERNIDLDLLYRGFFKDVGLYVMCELLEIGFLGNYML